MLTVHFPSLNNSLIAIIPPAARDYGALLLLLLSHPQPSSNPRGLEFIAQTFPDRFAKTW